MAITDPASEPRAALDHVRELVEPDERGELHALPDHAAPVHAYIPDPPPRYLRGSRPTRRATHPEFVAGPMYAAACGRWLQVLLPQSFEAGAGDDACPRCVTEVAAWKANPAAWHRARQDRRRARADREEEAAEVARWQALHQDATLPDDDR